MSMGMCASSTAGVVSSACSIAITTLVLPVGSSVLMCWRDRAAAVEEPVMAKTRFVIVLSDEERVELERRVACYTLPFKVVQRAKMILYAAEGRSNDEIARRVDTAAEGVGPRR